jgi:hypothetical protein
VAGNIEGLRDMGTQLEQTFKNLDACSKAAGATWAGAEDAARFAAIAIAGRGRA